MSSRYRAGDRDTRSREINTSTKKRGVKRYRSTDGREGYTTTHDDDSGSHTNKPHGHRHRHHHRHHHHHHRSRSRSREKYRRGRESTGFSKSGDSRLVRENYKVENEIKLKYLKRGENSIRESWRKKREDMDIDREKKYNERVSYHFLKATADAVHLPDVHSEVMKIVIKEREELKKFVIKSIRGKKGECIAHAKAYEERLIEEKKVQLKRLNEEIEELNKKIGGQQDALKTLKEEEEKKRREEERRRIMEEQERTRKLDEQRLLEIKKKVEKEEEREKILNRKKKRKTVSFSLFKL